MKLLLQLGHLRLRPALLHLIERRLLTLARRQRVEQAEVRLVGEPGAIPRHHVRILLRVPGPDLHVAASGPTPVSACHRAFTALAAQLEARRRRTARRRGPGLGSTPPSPWRSEG